MNEVIKVLESRRSCRNFKPEMIKEDELNTAGGVIVADKATSEILPSAIVYDGTECLIKAVESKIANNEAGSYNDVKPFYVMPSQAERDLANKK